jgi:hypothetical protein
MSEFPCPSVPPRRAHVETAGDASHGRPGDALFRLRLAPHPSHFRIIRHGDLIVIFTRAAWTIVSRPARTSSGRCGTRRFCNVGIGMSPIVGMTKFASLGYWLALGRIKSRMSAREGEAVVRPDSCEGQSLTLAV